MNWLRAIPNSLTVIRLLLCPVTAWFLFQYKFQVALWLFTFVAVTDFLDGYLARRWNAVSRLGSFLDPICDKIALLMILSALMVLGACPAWFLGLIISVTLLQGVGYIVYNLPTTPLRVTFDTLRIGKWNMALQYFWVSLVLLSLVLNIHSETFHLVRTIGYGILGGIQTTVFFAYFFHFRLHFSADFRALSPLK